ncbi:glycosyl transferase family 2 [Halosegnis rubeus]|uniref:Glycosyl transferase family 2 n=1 Tax=Halosegnis rubeus TaxID=2212850 RepID=A0A5N5UH76_9EURY|nr:glycosyl transferase family 2 [Halosegnis rubeus]KAB7518107.1 glycosyl transferase family 2 [Halosegnis rubeus]KAB7519319.1 glycosyl transferase family 2 [Halosegnis rubeus]
MEYVQEQVTTLHDFGDTRPAAPTNRAAVVVPMTEREHGSLAAEQVFTALESVAPDRVVVPLRADAAAAPAVIDWLDDFGLDIELLWCDGPRLGDLLADEDLNGTRGKGRDVWLALGVAAESPYVAVHDADATSYSANHVPRLLFPLDHGYSFSKGYYARVENSQLYGRLFRLLYRPLVRALAADNDADVLGYLESFRYALAGEFAATSEMVRSLRVQRGWGLEVGTLGDAYATAGFDGSTQVDLGRHEHDHRAVSGPAGLTTMADQVAAALLRVVEQHGVAPDYETLPDRYETAATRLTRAYATDAAFNGLSYDREDERRQVGQYADSIQLPGEDTRLPAWTDAPVSPDEVREAARRDVEALR